MINQRKQTALASPLKPFSAKRGKSALLLCASAAMLLTSCADAVGPKARNVSIPAPKSVEERSKAVNENGDPVIYLPLGDDVLVPQSEAGNPLPSTVVGPFELRSETLAGALQLVLDGTNIPIAFETEESLTRTITMTNLKGPLDTVVSEICSLGNMYCSYQNGMLVVKDTQVFTVSIPPIVSSEEMTALLGNISGAVGNITGNAPITDPGTRTIVYRASQRTAELAARYFQRLRSNTALVIYETYVWEVSLDSGNTTGIKWSLFDKVGRFKFGVNVSGAADTNVGTPISIGLPTTGTVDFDVSDVFQFVSNYGAVRTVSQPQLTVLSGSSAKLRIADTQNYVASLSRSTTDGGTTTVSTTTDSVDSGFTLNIGSNWDSSTVYGSIDILLQEVRRIDTFDENPDAVVQLPQTTERELKTQVRIRPGDLLLIAGLVRETDALDREGLGLSEPSLPFSRAAKASNTELVFLLRPRVVVFTSPHAGTPRKDGAPEEKAVEQADNVDPAPAQMLVQEPVKKEMEPVQPAVPEPVVSVPSAPSATMLPLPENPVSLPEPTAPETPDMPQKVVPESISRPVVTQKVYAEPDPVVPTYEVAPLAPVVAGTGAPSVEINMPDNLPADAQNSNQSPAVIINREILDGRSGSGN